jgi:hypothetical protein
MGVPATDVITEPVEAILDHPIDAILDNPKKSLLAGFITVICAYEILADTVNKVLDADLLPTISSLIPQLTVRRTVTFLSPQWLRNTLTLAVGFGIGILGRRRSRR